jgi:hypothetical protein
MYSFWVSVYKTLRISNYYQVKLIITYNKVYVTLDATIKHVRRRRHIYGFTSKADFITHFLDHTI